MNKVKPIIRLLKKRELAKKAGPKKWLDDNLAIAIAFRCMHKHDEIKLLQYMIQIDTLT